MISGIRTRTRKFSSILARPFVLAGVNPIAVSLLALPLALIYTFFVFQHDFLSAFFFALLAVLIDSFDGTVAREQSKATPFGNYIDAVIDKIVDFVLIGSFVVWFPVATILAVGFSFLTSFAKPRIGLVIITDNRDWPGIGERGDKLTVLLVGMLAAHFFPVIQGFATMNVVLSLVAAVSLVGFLQRVAYAKKLVAEAEKTGKLLPYIATKKKQ